MDLAPVLDLSGSSGPDTAHPNGPRSLSVSAPVATAYGLAFAQALEDGGVVPVVKHVPTSGGPLATLTTALRPIHRCRCSMPGRGGRSKLRWQRACPPWWSATSRCRA